MKKILVVLLTFLSISAFSQGFLHRNGQNIEDGKGHILFLEV
ncbi:hypothetical protein SAMN05444355_10396 [Flavobacterium frigoris]|uniref:Uncharacterized protein n=1 Tax=Flavobacterium frigoris TaxID=229204 RepID=A0A1H9HCH7_FLAFI|nr:hypothetical protein SAMN05444355_10396 [Flavobacterium frigoris]